MYSIILPFSIISLIAGGNYAASIDDNPIIVLSQAVIETEDSLPISVYWYHPKITKGDRLFVYSTVPPVKYPVIVYINTTIGSPTGYMELPRAAVQPDRNFNEFCAAIISNKKLLQDNPSCKPKTQWMYDRKRLLEGLSLMELVIPGTHQSAAYTTTSWMYDETLVGRWVLCQTASIRAQLLDGIRYLDLRPSAIMEDGKIKYVLTHGAFNLIPMDEAVKQINEFLDVSKDIVIVAFKGFNEGFKSLGDHIQFINYLEEAFYRYAHRRTYWTYRLGQFWEADQRLVLSYDHPAHAESLVTWPAIIQEWSDTQTISRLRSYFEDVHRKARIMFQPYAAMVQFTHSTSSIVQDIFGGKMSLRIWGEKVGKYIPEWYLGDWNKTASIIAVDFYQSSGIVDVAIQLNERRAMKKLGMQTFLKEINL